MPNEARLVAGHLENISGDVLAMYPEVIKKLIRGQSGIYALYRNESLYYVGLATNLMARLKTHLKDRHKQKWDRFSVYLTLHDEHMKELESLLLRIADPRGNKVRGKFNGSDNLRLQLKSLIKETNQARVTRLIGGGSAKSKVEKKAKSANGKRALAGIFERSIPLRGWHRGYEYRALLRKDGTIRYASEQFGSPSAAASAAAGRRMHGWWFWHYKTTSGEWARLRTLKG